MCRCIVPFQLLFLVVSSCLAQPAPNTSLRRQPGSEAPSVTASHRPGTSTNRVLTIPGQERGVATVTMAQGRPTVVVNEVWLRSVAPEAMKQLGLKDYAAVKASLERDLLSANSPSAKLQWPLRCTLWCRMHQACEAWEWVGFKKSKSDPAK